jgi:Protein of unknown function (DUF2950)
MTLLMNRFDRSGLRWQGSGALFASLALLTASYAPACLAQTSAAQISRPAGSADQPTYQSPEDAIRELYSALQSGDDPALRRVLGADDELVSSGDAATDKLDREQIVQKYQQMHRLVLQANGSMVLFIGAENWPFPIPVVSSNGAWRFDPETGAEEVRLRQIGESEVTAMQMCHALVEDQKRSGVYQETSTEEEAGSLLKTLLSGSPGGNKPALFRGYYFRILAKSRNGFTAVAYPAAYGTSGFMTFVVNGHDVVYEKDLGTTGARAAETMSKVRLDSTWKPAD